ncbi:hypothetical protein D3C75_1310710 [compost metagenome]
MGCFKAGFVQHIRLYADGRTAQRLNFLRFCLGRLKSTVQNGDLGAAFGKRSYKLAAQHTRTAGDHCNLPLQINGKWQG